MADGAVYNHKTNLFVLAGLPLFLGRATGTYFTFAYNQPARVQMSTGVDGSGYYFTTGDVSATMTLVVMPQSEDNDILMASHAAFLAAPNGLRSSILVQQGGSVYSGFGVVQGQPALEYADAPLTRTWTVVSTSMPGVIAGQPAAPTA